MQRYFLLKLVNCFHSLSSASLTIILLFFSIFPALRTASEYGQNKPEKRARRARKKINVIQIKQSEKITKRRGSPTLVEMTYEELTERRRICQKFDNKEGEIKILEQMLKICPTTDTLTKHWLELADLFFELKHFEMAFVTYKNFMTYYPGNTHFEYALYKAIQSAQYRLPSYDRDQSETEKLLELVDLYHQKDFVVYKSEIAIIQRQCIELLLLAELYIIEFYLNKGDIAVAKSRYFGLMENNHFITAQSDSVRNWHSTLRQRLHAYGIEFIPPISPSEVTTTPIHNTTTA